MRASVSARKNRANLRPIHFTVADIDTKPRQSVDWRGFGRRGPVAAVRRADGLYCHEMVNLRKEKYSNDTGGERNCPLRQLVPTPSASCPPDSCRQSASRC
jgi:hypothetical protein